MPPKSMPESQAEPAVQQVRVARIKAPEVCRFGYFSDIRKLLSWKWQGKAKTYVFCQQQNDARVIGHSANPISLRDPRSWTQRRRQAPLVPPSRQRRKRQHQDRSREGKIWRARQQSAEHRPAQAPSPSTCQPHQAPQRCARANVDKAMFGRLRLCICF